MASRKLAMVVAMVAAAVMSLAVAQPTPADMSCIQTLIPCAGFLNSTKPPDECCGPLTDAFKTQFKCLCAAFNNPALTSSSGVNMTQVLELPRHCGINADPNDCSKAQGPAAASTPEASPSIVKPTPAQDTGAASSIAPIAGLVLVVVSMMLY